MRGLLCSSGSDAYIEYGGRVTECRKVIRTLREARCQNYDSGVLENLNNYLECLSFNFSPSLNLGMVRTLWIVLAFQFFLLWAENNDWHFHLKWCQNEFVIMRKYQVSVTTLLYWWLIEREKELPINFCIICSEMLFNSIQPGFRKFSCPALLKSFGCLNVTTEYIINFYGDV